MKNITKFIIILIILALIGSGIYYWLYFVKDTNSNTDIVENGEGTGFKPLNSNNAPRSNGNSTVSTSTNNTNTKVENNNVSIPKLRQLSFSPIAGMYASTTKIKVQNSSTTIEKTIVRYVDRGTGHVYETNDIDSEIIKISNTTLPKIYEAYWNKNLNKSILRYLKDNTDTIVNFYSELRAIPNSTASSTTPFEIKGKYLASDIKQIAVSPNEEKIFTWNIESGKGIGYISAFDEKNKTKVFDTPLNQVNIDWPETNTLTITTKGSVFSSGYSYSINTKTSEMKKIIGNIRGLSVKMSNDAKQIIYSSTNNEIDTYLLNIKDGKTTNVIFKTLVDKCVWSKIRKDEIYCAVPVEIPDANYPDDWYKGNVSFIDQIWALNTTTGEVYLLANLLELSNQLIDASNLVLDPKENYLYFINKNDLNLWSLDLNQ